MMSELDDSSSFYNRYKHLWNLPDAIRLWQPGQSFISAMQVYTFSATSISLRIWAPGPPREPGGEPALPAQLCWSSGSSFLRTSQFDLNLASHRAYSTVKGQRLDYLQFFRCPGVFALPMVSLSSLKFLIFAKWTQLNYQTAHLHKWIVVCLYTESCSENKTFFLSRSP